MRTKYGLPLIKSSVYCLKCGEKVSDPIDEGYKELTCKNCGNTFTYLSYNIFPSKKKKIYGLSCSCGSDLSEGVEISGNIAWSYCEKCDMNSKFYVDRDCARPLERIRGRKKR